MIFQVKMVLLISCGEGGRVFISVHALGPAEYRICESEHTHIHAMCKYMCVYVHMYLHVYLHTLTYMCGLENLA